MQGRGHARPAGLSRAAIALVAIAAFGPMPSPVRAETAPADWEHDWVALTVARNGAWGAAINANVVRAMRQAIGECFSKAGAVGNDCGAEITTVRASWSLAYACGDYTFISNGDTPADARAAAVHRAIDLKEILGLELPPCVLVVGIDPAGRPPSTGELNDILPLR